MRKSRCCAQVFHGLGLSTPINSSKRLFRPFTRSSMVRTANLSVAAARSPTVHPRSVNIRHTVSNCNAIGKNEQLVVIVIVIVIVVIITISSPWLKSDWRKYNKLIWAHRLEKRPTIEQRASIGHRPCDGIHNPNYQWLPAIDRWDLPRHCFLLVTVKKKKKKINSRIMYNCCGLERG